MYVFRHTYVAAYTFIKQRSPYHLKVAVTTPLSVLLTFARSNKKNRILGSVYENNAIALWGELQWPVG